MMLLPLLSFAWKTGESPVFMSMFALSSPVSLPLGFLTKEINANYLVQGTRLVRYYPLLDTLCARLPWRYEVQPGPPPRDGPGWLRSPRLVSAHRGAAAADRGLLL